VADINWPTGLRPSIKASKSRDEIVGFRESPVTSGPSLIEPFSDDTPVFYSVQFIFTKDEARAFQSWLRINRIKTNSPFFNFPLLIEDPNVDTQEARFTLDGYPQLVSETNSIFTYSGRILIRKIISEDEAHDGFILQLSEATGYMADPWMSDLDRVLNTPRT
jgi:hypothetical protein